MEKKFLTIAINIAKKNIGKTTPNPVVGCVIVKNGEIISSAATAFNGRPHAERIAIDKVKDKEKLVGATLYVSLEPCCHFGKTPPCVDVIIQSGIKKVVIASIDNDKRVNRQGIEFLKRNNIEVEIIEIQEAYEINRGFFKANQGKIPFTTLKLAVSLDGKIALKNQESKWITCEDSRKFSHYLRSTNDAILVGANTVKKDNPSLDCRISGLENFSPKRFIITKKIDFDINLKIFQNCNEIPTFILTLNNQKSQNFDEFEKIGVKTLFCAEKNNEIDLKSALNQIYQQEVNSLLIEGGNNLATKILQENLVDELIWIQSNKILGNDALSAIGDLNFTQINQSLQNFKLISSKKSGENDVINIFQK